MSRLVAVPRCQRSRVVRGVQWLLVSQTAAVGQPAAPAPAATAAAPAAPRTPIDHGEQRRTSTGKVTFAGTPPAPTADQIELGPVLSEGEPGTDDRNRSGQARTARSRTSSST